MHILGKKKIAFSIFFCFMGNNILVFSPDLIVLFSDTVKPVLSGHLKIDIIKVLMENGSVMKVESIAECSPWSILQYF